MSLLSATAHQAHFSSFTRTLFTIAGFKPFLLSFVPSTQRSKQQDWSYTAFWYCSNCSSIDMGWECTDWKRRARLKFTFCPLCLLVCSGMLLIWEPLHWLLADMQMNRQVLPHISSTQPSWEVSEPRKKGRWGREMWGVLVLVKWWRFCGERTDSK